MVDSLKGGINNACPTEGVGHETRHSKDRCIGGLGGGGGSAAVGIDTRSDLFLNTYRERIRWLLSDEELAQCWVVRVCRGDKALVKVFIYLTNFGAVTHHGAAIKGWVWMQRGDDFRPGLY